MVIHTSKAGARGVNFDLFRDAIVLCAFNPTNYADCVQALGRGCRNEQGRGEGVLIVSEEHTEINEATILNFLSDDSLGDEQSDDLRIRILRRAHEQFFSMCEEDAKFVR